MEEINSREYWERRFSEDWEENEGRGQTSFFCGLILDNLPGWFIKEVTEKKLSICDWGCAEGDCVNMLSGRFPGSRVAGIDFSREAIARAKQYYPSNEFIAGEIDSIRDRFDVLITSNTLEHFERPGEVLEKLKEITNRYICLLLPFREKNPIQEHKSLFDFGSFPVRIGDFFLLNFKVMDCLNMDKTLWPGDQVLVIYANGTSVELNDFSLYDLNPGVAHIFSYLRKKEEELAAEISVLKGELSAIHESRAWQVASAYYGMRKRISTFWKGLRGGTVTR